VQLRMLQSIGDPAQWQLRGLTSDRDSNRCHMCAYNDYNYSTTKRKNIRGNPHLAFCKFLVAGISGLERMQRMSFANRISKILLDQQPNFVEYLYKVYRNKIVQI